VQEKTNVGTYKYPFSIDLPEDLPTTIFKSELLKASYKYVCFYKPLPAVYKYLSRSVVYCL